MKNNEIKGYFPRLPFKSSSLAGHVCVLIAPYLTYLFIRWKVSPNMITLLMIIVGVVAGAVLFVPFWWCKIIAGLLYYLWYALDLTDGKVARLTKVFSKGGKYLDWCAHLVTHSLFAVAMWWSLLQNDCYFIITIVSFVFVICELFGRNRIAMDTLYGNIDNSPYYENVQPGLLRYCYNSLVYIPNEILIFPMLLGLSIVMNWNWFYWVYIIWAIFYSAVIFRVFIIFIWRMFKSE